MVVSDITEQRACPRCGCIREERQCSTCDGTGTRGIWFWQRSCDVCAGTGVVHLCSNEIAHLFEFNQTARSTHPLAASRTRCPTCHETAMLLNCPVCEGEGNVPIVDLDPARTRDLRRNPFLPDVSSPMPAAIFRACERCSGTGQIMYCPACGRLSPHSRSRIVNMIHRACV